MKDIAVVWFRNDLRIEDHVPLYQMLHLAKQGVIGICFQTQENTKYLFQLSQLLKSVHIPLCVFHAHDDPVAIVCDFLMAHGISRLSFYLDQSIKGMQDRCIEKLQLRGIYVSPFLALDQIVRVHDMAMPIELFMEDQHDDLVAYPEYCATCDALDGYKARAWHKDLKSYIPSFSSGEMPVFKDASFALLSEYEAHGVISWTGLKHMLYQSGRLRDYMKYLQGDS